MSLLDFIKEFCGELDNYTEINLQWNWNDEGYDEEYSFEGKPSDFVWYYTEVYNILHGIYVADVFDMRIKKVGCFRKIFIEIIGD